MTWVHKKKKIIKLPKREKEFVHCQVNKQNVTKTNQTWNEVQMQMLPLYLTLCSILGDLNFKMVCLIWTLDLHESSHDSLPAVASSSPKLQWHEN